MITDLATYRRLARDTTSSDSDVLTALMDAQNLFETETNRYFEQAERTETMRLWMSGRVYPKAFPIAAVSNQPGAVIDGASIMVGYGYQYAQGINPFVSGFGADTTYYQPQVTMTYTGGYTPDAMPADVKRAIVEIAFNELHPVPLEQVPVGATQVSVGDVRIAGMKPLSGFEIMTPSINRVIRRYKRQPPVSF